MILFLDFDGVLHPEFDGQATPPEVAFCHVQRFEAVMRDHPEVEILISSTWREQFPLDALRARFSPDIAARIIDKTPVTPRVDGHMPARREGEILDWLVAARREHDEQWLVLDDAAWQFPQYSDRLIACTWYVGMDDAVEAALRSKLSAMKRQQCRSVTGQSHD